MKLYQCFLFIPCFLVLTACGQKDNADIVVSSAGQEEIETTSSPSPVPQIYTELGDLSALQRRGQIRLIAPLFDGADALPKEGISVQDYQRIAEQFSNSLGLAVQWVYVEAFTDLIPTLESGLGDLIVTNMTETQARKERVNFSRSINQVDEVIVGGTDLGLTDLELNDLALLEEFSLTVPNGSAYVDSLAAHNSATEKPIKFDTIPATHSNVDILSAIVEGTYQATVLDSNVAQSLLLDYPSLQVGATLNHNRPIAWAVRNNNPDLLRELNQFLVSHFLSRATDEIQVRDWAAIKNSGRLRVLMLNNPASYFMWRGELRGFDYELAKYFAEQHQLYLSVVLKNSISELFAALKNGEGDLIASSITKTPERASKDIVFSRPYMFITEKLVGRADGPSIENIKQLAGMRVGVNIETVFYQRLEQLKKDGIALELVKYQGTLTEELFEKLADQEFDFMLADSHLVAMEQVYDNDLKINIEFEEQSEIAWVIRNDQSEFKQAVDDFIRTSYRGLFYNITFKKYFANERKMRSMRSDRIVDGSALSPYDDIVAKFAEKYAMDWRLLTAQMYQESRFNPAAKSFAGAEGLMQVMPRTGKEFGFDNLTDPETGIEAGVVYLNWLEKRFPGDIDFQERIYFQLAAYNAGAGHVRDARRLAKQQGLNPNRWFDHVEKAMLLLSKREYYKKARFGYVRGREPVAYVKSIRDRYLAYLSTTGQ